MKETRKWKAILAVIVLCAGGTVACSNDGAFEEAGEELDEAADDVQDSLDDAADEVEREVN
ncbi:MAG: hypothetical protein AAF648_09840 [Pseudomonadota bacterium]